MAGLLTGSPATDGVPHVAGVRLADGEEIAADLVVDATGRRSPTTDWITEIGGRAPEEEAEDFGFTYTGRFFRSADGSVPELPGAVLTPVGSISLLCIPADNGTWSTTVYSASSDAPLRRLRDAAMFERVVRECAGFDAWLDGEPISDMVSMSGIVDRTRHFVVDGAPVVTGMVSIADAHACTNPSIGRGMSLGLMHTMVMRDTVRAHLDDPLALALAFDEATRTEVDPWHDATRAIDRGRIAEIRAAIDGREPPPDPTGGVAAALFTAATVDEQAARWAMEILGCWTLPTEVFSREGAIEHVLEVAKDVPPPSAGRPRPPASAGVGVMSRSSSSTATRRRRRSGIRCAPSSGATTSSPCRRRGSARRCPRASARRPTTTSPGSSVSSRAMDGPIDLVGHDWGGGHVQRVAADATRPDPLVGDRHRRRGRPGLRVARHGQGVADTGRRRGGRRDDVGDARRSARRRLRRRRDDRSGGAVVRRGSRPGDGPVHPRPLPLGGAAGDDRVGT